jgi:hypothetical protein
MALSLRTARNKALKKKIALAIASFHKEGFLEMLV